MKEPEHVIPRHRLPPGFARSLEHPPEHPAEPRPAATVVILRPGPRGVEVLLVRRSRNAGFVPGAYVFPGGRVDRQDGDPALLGRWEAPTARHAARRLGLPLDAEPPALAYYLAAVREAFEETGLLVGQAGPEGSPAAAPGAIEVREALLDGRVGFSEALDRLGCRPDCGSLEYIAHWITPEAEPRRYDTRFFAAAVPAGAEAAPDPREMVDAVWLTPGEALERSLRGQLPMVFPTLRTLEQLRGFASPHEVLEAFGDRDVPAILPRLVVTPDGVGIRMPEEDASG